MWWFAPEQQRWILQPLIDAGLPTDDICRLLHRLADGEAPRPDELVSDQPAPVRAAWTHTIDRLLTLPEPVDQPPARTLPMPRSPH